MPLKKKKELVDYCVVPEDNHTPPRRGLGGLKKKGLPCWVGGGGGD